MSSGFAWATTLSICISLATLWALVCESPVNKVILIPAAWNFSINALASLRIGSR
ncbi:Uncharacterised protein [Vibrio cholerae]|nr:Uncharacterised protein [Vibrio cholerae]